MVKDVARDLRYASGSHALRSTWRILSPIYRFHSGNRKTAGMPLRLRNAKPSNRGTAQRSASALTPDIRSHHIERPSAGFRSHHLQIFLTLFNLNEIHPEQEPTATAGRHAVR